MSAKDLKDAFIGLIIVAAGLTWVGFLIAYGRVNDPLPGGKHFMLGTALTFLVTAGLFILAKKDEDEL